MKFILEVSAGLGLAAMVISFIDVTKNPDTKGWVFGISLLLCLVFGFLAIWRA